MSPDLGTPLSQLLCSRDMEPSFCEHIHTYQYKLMFQVHLFLYLYNFIYFWLCCLHCCTGFLQLWRVGATLQLRYTGFSHAAGALGCLDFSRCGTRALQLQFLGYRAQAQQWWCRMWSLLYWQVGSSTTQPPGKPFRFILQFPFPILRISNFSREHQFLLVTNGTQKPRSGCGCQVCSLLPECCCFQTLSAELGSMDAYVHKHTSISPSLY